MFRNRLRFAAIVLAAAALYACGDQDRPTAPDIQAPLPASIIVDASTGGNDGVLFLPPLRPLGPRNGVFDPTIPLRLEITHQGSATVEQYSVAAGDITVGDDHYALPWTAPETAVAGAVFEVRAFALGFELGRVDIVVAGSGRDYVELKQADESATIRNSSRTLPIHVWLNTEALAPTEEQLEQECASGGAVIDCDVEVIPNSTGGSVTVYDESDPDAPLAGELTVDPGDVVDQNGDPVEAYVLTLLHLDQPATQSTTVPADQQFPFVLRATITDGAGNPLSFATGASLVLCQPADMETNQAAPYYLPTALAVLQQIIKVDNGTTTFLPTTYGAPECEGSQPPVQIGLESLGSVEGLGRLARLGLRKLKHFVVAEPLRAGHGGLTTTKSILDLSEFAGALSTDPSVSTATVPDGTVGQPTEIAIQAKVSGASTVFDQVNGGDAVEVVISGANAATLSVGSGIVDNGDGTYTATYTPVNAGTDQVDIRIRNIETEVFEAISGSPFTSEVQDIPDLVVSSVGTVAISGTDVSVDATLSNLGGPAPEFPASSTWDVAVYLSTDAVLDGSDTHLTSMYTAWTYPVGTGWSATSTLSGSLPGATAPGQYYLIVVADAFPNQPPNNYPGVEESDEANNWTASAAFTVGSPDLMVSVFTAPATAQLDEAIGDDVFLQITNIGTAGIPAETSVSIGFYISTDENITTADRLLQGGRENLHPDALAAGASIVIPLFSGANVSSTVPDANPPLGNVFIGVVLDEFDGLTELDESNNTASLPIQITSPPLTVLVPSTTSTIGPFGGTGGSPTPVITDCPAGSVAVGLDGTAVNYFGWATMYGLSLRCRVLNPDGTLGAPSTVADLGDGMGTISSPTPFLADCAANAMLVSVDLTATTADGTAYVTSVEGGCGSLARVLGALGGQDSSIGPFAGTGTTAAVPYAAACGPGYVVTGFVSRAGNVVDALGVRCTLVTDTPPA